MTTQKLPAFERLMIFFSLFTIGLLIYRCIFTLSFHYTYFIWNLFLSFTPYIISKQLIKNKELNFKSIFLLAGWLFLFPACVYLFTDLMQIKQTDNFPLWYDVVLYVSVALNGLLPGLMSVKKVEIFLKEHVSLFFVKSSILICFFLSSYSTCLVEFLHLKSWNMIIDTRRFITASERDILSPENHVHIWLTIITSVLLLDLMYEVFKKLPVNNIKTANDISIF